MIDTEILFSPLAIAGAVTGVVLALIAGRFRRESAGTIVLTALGSGLALAALGWASSYGQGALFAAISVGLGATLWSRGIEQGRDEHPTIR